MPIYTIATPDGRKLKIEADDEQSAINGAQQWSRQNKPKRSPVENVTGFMANVNRGLGIGDELAAGVKTAAGAISDGVSGRQGPALDQRYRNALRDQRAIEDTYAAEKPKMAALGRGTGMAATAVLPAGQTGNALALSSRGVNAARGAVAAGLTGAAYAAADRGTGRERLRAASRAATDPTTLALGAAGGAMAPARPRPQRPSVSEDVRLLRERGIELTPGQAGGNMAKMTEEAAGSIPFVGDSIKAARTRGNEQFNRENVREALRQIGEELPDDIATGADAIRYAGDRLSARYEAVLPEGVVVPDEQFAQAVRDRIGDISTDMTPATRQRVLNILENRVVSRMQGGADGKTFQRVTGELTTAAKRFSSSTDADQQAVGEALLGVRDELMEAAARQNPQFAQAKAQADRGWAQLATIESAGAKAGAEGSIYTPKQFMASVRQGDASVRRRATARGTAPGQEFAGAAERVMSNKLPDSGTGRRVMQLGAGGALGYGAATNPAAAVATVAGGGAAMAAYSRPGIQLFNRILDSRIAAADRAVALNELRQMATQSPEARQLYAEVMRRLPQAAGVAGQAPQPMAAGY